jgi:hypothetical protein
LETDTPDNYLHHASDRAQWRLYTQDGIRRADDGRDVNLPNIVKPLVAPTPEDDQPGFLLLITYCRVFPGPWQLVVFVTVREFRLTPLIIVPKIQDTNASIEHAPTSALLVCIGAASKHKDTPRRNGLNELHCTVPTRHTPRKVQLRPILILHVEHEEVTEL